LCFILIPFLIWIQPHHLFAQATADTLQPETFEYQQGNTTYVMQKYFIAFLKSGPQRSQSEKEVQALQKKHLAHINKLRVEG
jgi:hypothetical protein